MNNHPQFTHLLVVPRLRVQNANAISSPLTHGFPAISAFMGLMWALERKTQAAGLDLMFHAVGVVAHDWDEQTTDDYFASTYRLTRNPQGKDGKPQAIVEEGRMHMTISLVFAVQSQMLDNDQEQAVAQQIKNLLETMRIAGGSVLPSVGSKRLKQPFAIPISHEQNPTPEHFAQFKRVLLPGFTLVERQDLLDQRFQKLAATDPSTTRLDAWLSLSRFNWRWNSKDEPEKGEWKHDREGYLVPIPVGYGALSELHAAGTVAGARDVTTDFRFVESLFSIGQWLSPHRLTDPSQLLWYPEYHIDTAVYRCTNDFIPQSTIEFID